MKKKILLTLLAVMASSLVSCGSDKTTSGDYSTFKIISPVGAPAITSYNFILNGQAETNTNGQIVRNELLSNKYDAVIFDFYNGLKTVSNNHANYKLARLITGGNIFLIGVNKSEEEKEIKEDSLVIGFNEGSIPDLAFEKLYEDTSFYFEHVANNSDLAPVIKTGQFDHTPVDYIVAAEPLVSKLLKDVTYPYTLINLREKWGNKFDMDPFIYQAGLFINTTNYEEKKGDFDLFINKINNNINLCLDNPEAVKQEIDDNLSIESQTSLFGFDSTTFLNITKNNNGFGLLKDNSFTNMEKFLKKLGKYDEEFNNYIFK